LSHDSQFFAGGISFDPTLFSARSPGKAILDDEWLVDNAVEGEQQSDGRMSPWDQHLASGWISLEPFPFRRNRNGALGFCFDAFSSREPASTSLENALESRDALCEAVAPPRTAGSRGCANRRLHFPE
jgi:hypothetical protein